MRILETESSTINTINNIKKYIYENLPSCDTHIQGCLISEDGQHLKLDADLVTLWARAIFTQMKGIDKNTTPNLPLFDKSKYHYPISKWLSNTLLKEANTIDITSTSVANSYLSTIDSTSTMADSKTFLLEQVMSQVFINEHAHIWIEVEEIKIQFNDLFD
ncbi:hypothetical protein C2G38_2152312 [Gigaspora rosea]|uniref:Uncharacterized protein n=1 Tax=Gigaspora rosea TaxID=44941 RepID=A0A397W8G9_9GLOM|nr:hypothetical protein C2G38_2152312 [Gigaspora rosea]